MTPDTSPTPNVEPPPIWHLVSEMKPPAEEPVIIAVMDRNGKPVNASLACYDSKGQWRVAPGGRFVPAAWTPNLWRYQNSKVAVDTPRNDGNLGDVVH